MRVLMIIQPIVTLLADVANEHPFNPVEIVFLRTLLAVINRPFTGVIKISI
jgi:hypothetical protein